MTRFFLSIRRAVLKAVSITLLRTRNPFVTVLACRDGQNHHVLMILKSKSNHLNKGNLNRNNFGSGDLKLKITLKIK